MRQQNWVTASKVTPKPSLRQDFSTLSDDVMLASHEVAELLSISVWTVKSWRHEGKGPRATKLGRSVRFRVGDVRAWLDKCREAS